MCQLDLKTPQTPPELLGATGVRASAFAVQPGEPRLKAQPHADLWRDRGREKPYLGLNLFIYEMGIRIGTLHGCFDEG